jgi:endonuclease-3
MTLAEKYEGVINYFKVNVPIAETELQYSNPFELLVAVILSAQCTDKRINQVTPKLFKDFPTAEVMAASNSDTIFSYIRSVSYPNNKAKHLVSMANMLMSDFNGIIPSEINDLVKLPGVGRKTANVVASVIYNKPAMAVDTHVFRVSNRLGLTKAKTALASEMQLIKHIPKENIATAHHWLILHGRYTCLARSPKCDACLLTEWCSFFKTKKINKNFPHSLSHKTKVMPVKKSIKPKEQKKETVKVTVKSKTKEEPKSKFIAHTTSLKVGDKAPAFKEKNQEGKLISLADFKGKNVILYFYPKDSTPACTMEACSLRDDHSMLTKKNFVTLGVSADDEKSHLKFATKHELPFSLLADTDMKIIKAYDVWGTKQFMGKIYDGIIRTTFVINDKGVIKHIITDVKTKEHANQILSLS